MAFPIESYAAKIQRKLLKKQRVIEAASGRQKADLVLKNATYVNVFSNELLTCDIAVANGLIVGLGSYEGEVEYDMTGKIVCPGFVDAHIHLESSLVTPKEFVRATLPHGTTTVITDPHEITNVMGTDGIDYMLCATEGLPVAPKGDIHDGKIDFVVIRKVNRLKLPYLLTMFLKGKLLTLKCTDFYRCERLSLDVAPKIPMNCDGELIDCLPAEISILPGALNCIMPKKQ